MGAWLLFYAVSSASHRPDVGRRAWSLLALLAAQIAAGVVNLLLLAPVWMQLVHLLLADLLWISLVLLCAATLKFQPRAADPPSDEMGVDSTRLQRHGTDHPYPRDHPNPRDHPAPPTAR